MEKVLDKIEKILSEIRKIIIILLVFLILQIIACRNNYYLKISACEQNVFNFK